MGEIAAILTAVCWSLSPIFFTMAVKRVGSVIVNRIRLLFAVSLLMISHLFLQGTLLPLQAGGERWLWLGVSGVVGLVLGDAFLFQSYAMVGARIATLIMATGPVFSAVIAWLFLGETLTPLQIAGICVAMAGVALVVLEQRNGHDTHHDRRRFRLGLLSAFGGALGQALGLVLAKRGLYGDFPSISGVVIRMVSAMAVMWLVTIAIGRAPATLRAFRQPRVIAAIGAASLVGPFIGVWLSLIAIQLTKVGIASTLIALTPVIQLPISRFVLKEKVSWRVIFGTAVAIAGVVIIFV